MDCIIIIWDLQNKRIYIYIYEVPGLSVFTIRGLLAGLLPNTVIATIVMIYVVFDSKFPIEYSVEIVLIFWMHSDSVVG